MFAYRIYLYHPYTDMPENEKLFLAQYKRSKDSGWISYAHSKDTQTWDEAYKTLEKHANSAALALKFVGTF